MGPVVGEKGGVERVEVGLDAGLRERAPSELAGAVADHLLDDRERRRRDAELRERRAERARDVGHGVDQRAVQIEDDEVDARPGRGHRP